MAIYETGTATTSTDLLDKIRVFALGNSWVVNRWIVAGSGKELCLSKGTSYVNFRSYENESATLNGVVTSSNYGIGINGSDNYGAGNAWDRQPGYPVRNSATNGDQAHCYMPLQDTPGPFVGYYLFATTDCIYLELEASTEVFYRLGFGKLTLFNTSVGGDGRFCYATGGCKPAATWLNEDLDHQDSLELVPFRGTDYSYNSFTISGSMLRIIHDVYNGWAGSIRAPSSMSLPRMCQGSTHKLPMFCSPNNVNFASVLLPHTISLNISNTFAAPVGILPNLRFINIANYNPKDEFPLGSDVWKVFPWHSKNVYSNVHGIAFKKN